VRAIARPAIACPRRPERHVSLRGQILARSVVRPVVDHEEVADPEFAVVGPEEGQTNPLAAQVGDQTDRVPTDCGSAVGGGRQFTPLAECTKPKPLAPKSQPIAFPKAHTVLSHSLSGSPDRPSSRS